MLTCSGCEEQLPLCPRSSREAQQLPGGSRGKRTHLMWHTQAWTCGHIYCSPFQPSLSDSKTSERRENVEELFDIVISTLSATLPQAGFLPPVVCLVPKSVGLLCWGSALFLNKEQSFSSKAQQ